MKRIVLFLLIIMTFALGLDAQGKHYVKPGKFDNKLAGKLQNGKPSDTVKVIIRTHDLPSLPGKLSKGQVKNAKSLGSFPGMAAEIPLSRLQEFANDAAIDGISSDEAIGSSDASNGVEQANNSSGGLVAFNKWKSAGAGIGVAIIDSGIAAHPDLKNSVVYRVDFTGQAPGKTTDPYGHGTHVAGIAAGSGSSAGIANQARLVDLRVLDSTGAGSTSTVISAIDWAINNQNVLGTDGKPLNIRVINLSLGHMPLEGADTDPLALEARKAVQAGIVVVAAAGNYGKDASGNTIYGGILTPGIEPSVITVGAVTTWGTPSRSDDVVASYSSRGPTIDGLLKPDITAPGSRIESATSPGNTLITAHPTLQVDPAHMMLSGTSMASPIVAGAVAMILAKAPALTPNAVKAILTFTSEKRGSPLDWGAGYINVAGAMDLAMSVDPTVAAGGYWILPGTTLPSSEVVNGYTTVWGQTIVWGDSLYTGTSLYYNKPVWSLTIVWGETIVWGDTIVWGETIVWSDSVPAESMLLSAQTIVWDVSADTIIWGESADQVDDQ